MILIGAVSLANEIPDEKLQSLPLPKAFEIMNLAMQKFG